MKPHEAKAAVDFLCRVVGMAYWYLRSKSENGGSTKGAVTRLTEYRTTLIAAATNGKIDVRNWKPKEQAA